MDPLKVNPPALDAYGSVVGRAAGDIDVVRGYVQKFGGNVTANGGWLAQLLGPHRTIMGYVEKSVLGALSDSTHTSGTNLGRAAAYYRATERAVARRFDDGLFAWDRNKGDTGLIKPQNTENDPVHPPGTWPPVKEADPKDLAALLDPSHPVGRNESLADLYGKAFKPGQYGDATSLLTAPGTPKEFEDPNALWRSIANWVSPAWCIEQVLSIWNVKNPWKWGNDKVTGDWTAYAKASEGWRHTGQAMTVIGSNIGSGNEALDGQWDGRAAEAAFMQFRNLSNISQKSTAMFDKLSDAYMKAAQGVWSFAKAASDLLDGMFDACVWAAIAFGLAAATSETGVGAVAGGAGAAAAAATFWKLYQEFSGHVDKTEQIIHATVGNVMSLSGNGALTGGLDVPAAYSHPAMP